MIAILKALISIAKNLQRIREILEIIHQPELEYHALSQRYEKLKVKEKDSDREFDIKYEAKDIYEEVYGETLEDEI